MTTTDFKTHLHRLIQLKRTAHIKEGFPDAATRTDRLTRAATMLAQACTGRSTTTARFTSDGNRAFDESLKRQSPTSGIRDFEAVDALATSIGFELIADQAMPANNRMLVWRRIASS